MINSIKFYLPDGTTQEITVGGKSGVSKIFYDRDNPNKIIVLASDEIIEYGDIPYVASKSYKEKE